MITKNYLPEKQIKKLERTVASYFDYIEDYIEDENTFTMEGFAQRINEFLAFRKYDILDGKGKVSKKTIGNTFPRVLMHGNQSCSSHMAPAQDNGQVLLFYISLSQSRNNSRFAITNPQYLLDKYG